MAESSTGTSNFAPLPIAAGAVVVLLLAATVGLWAYFGTAVFFEVVRAGWAACF